MKSLAVFTFFLSVFVFSLASYAGGTKFGGPMYYPPKAYLTVCNLLLGSEIEPAIVEALQKQSTLENPDTSTRFQILDVVITDEVEIKSSGNKNVVGQSYIRRHDYKADKPIAERFIVDTMKQKQLDVNELGIVQRMFIRCVIIYYRALYQQKKLTRLRSSINSIRSFVSFTTHPT